MDLTKLDELVPQLQSMKRDDLFQMLKSLQVLLSKTKDCISAMETPSCSSIDNLSTLQVKPELDDKLLKDVSEHLNTLKYHPNTKNPNSPTIYLYGSQQYKYNAQSAAVKPTPIIPDSEMGKLLEAVNTKLSTNFNSMLINRYKDYRCFLGVHKDDEDCLDPTAPISSISFGATRSLNISMDAAKHFPVKTLTLTPGSIFTMMPGFQDHFWHAIAPGRKGASEERGLRFSITFRKLLPCEGDHSPATNANDDIAVPQAVTISDVAPPTLSPAANNHAAPLRQLTPPLLLLQVMWQIHMSLEVLLLRVWMSSYSPSTPRNTMYSVIAGLMLRTFMRL